MTDAWAAAWITAYSKVDCRIWSTAIKGRGVRPVFLEVSQYRVTINDRCGVLVGRRNLISVAVVDVVGALELP